MWPALCRAILASSTNSVGTLTVRSSVLTPPWAAVPTALPKAIRIPLETRSAPAPVGPVVLPYDMVGIDSELEIEVGPSCYLERVTVCCNPCRLKSYVPYLAGLPGDQSQNNWKGRLKVTHIIMYYFASRNAAHVLPAVCKGARSSYTYSRVSFGLLNSSRYRVFQMARLVYKPYTCFGIYQVVMGVEAEISPARGASIAFLPPPLEAFAKTHMSLTMATSGSISPPSRAPASSIYLPVS